MINKKIWTYDIETIINCFLVVFKNRDTGEYKRFIILDGYKIINERQELINFIKTEVRGLISFNGNKFDWQVIEHILCGKIKTTNDIYKYAQDIISRQDDRRWLDYPEWKFKIPQLDLFLIWHFDNRAKITSLKWVQFMIDWYDLREMSKEHFEPIENDEELKELIYYCDNDVNSTEEFYWITKGKTDHPEYKGKDKIELRRGIKKEFDINCMNFNDVKIGEQIIQSSYMKTNKISKNDLYSISKPELKPFQFKDCISDYISFKTDKFNDFFNKVKETWVDVNSKQEFHFTINGFTVTIAKGGIHSEDKPRLFKKTKGWIIRDADIGSQYPNKIRKGGYYPKHLNSTWLDEYTGIISKRIEAKKSGNKPVNEALKLALNGGSFGKMGEERNWQYDPFTLYNITIGNQFEIMMLIEDFFLNDITVFSANTDGLTCYFPEEKEELYYQICKDWEIKVGNDKLGQLEYTDYDLFAQTSVNDYLALKPDGKTKHKGDFLIDYEIHKNKSRRIVGIALNNYFIKNIPVEKTIKNHNNIFDFCCAVRAVGGAELYLMNQKTTSEEKQQKTCRYYVSNSDTVLVKRMKPLENKTPTNQLDIFGDIDDGTRQSKVEAGYNQTLFNQYEKKEDYNINYNYYIDKTMDIINKIKFIPINQTKI